MRNSKVIALVAAASSTLAIFAGGQAPAHAVANDSDQALHFFVDPGTGAAASYADSNTQFNWLDNVVGANSTTDVTAPFYCPADSTGTYVFVAKRGTERQGRNNYLAYLTGAFVPGTTTVLEPLLKLSATTNGIWKGQTLKYINQTDNPLSFGISCTKDDGLTTLWASYRYITITSMLTGAWTAEPAPTGTQTTPPTTSPTPTPTPTTPTPTPTPTTPTPTPTPTPTETIPPIVPVSTPSWLYGNTVYHVNVRNFSATGTIQGFRDQLPRLKKLGIKVVDFSPLTPISAGATHIGNLGSPYAVDDYQAFNTDLGTGTDFRYLVDYMHSQGMRVIVGWNAQSTGWLNGWIASHPDWYVSANGAIQSPAGSTNTDKALLDYSNKAMRSAMISAMKWWITSYGVDGFDCAYASQVPADFWDTATAVLNATKTGLAWIADEDTHADLKVNSFATGLNQSLESRLINLKSGATTLAQFADSLNSIQTPANTSWMPLNFVTNDFTSSGQGSEVKVYGKNANAISLLTFTLPGNTMLFNGQEIGNSTAFGLGNKGTLKWPGSASTTAIFKSFITLRAKNQSLWSGPTEGTIQTFQTGNAGVLGFQRTSGSNTVIVLMNLGAKNVKNAKAIFSSAPGSLFSITTGKAVKLPAIYKYSLAAGGYLVFSTVAAN